MKKPDTHEKVGISVCGVTLEQLHPEVLVTVQQLSMTPEGLPVMPS